MGLLKLIGTLFVVCGGSAMTLHVLKEMKNIEVVLWPLVILLFVLFLAEIYRLISIKLNLILELLSGIAKHLKIRMN